MKLLTELILRVVLIVTITDVLEFYVILRNHGVITVPLAIGIIVVTIVPLVISIWFSLYRRGIK
jgi:hypothetical protein